MSESSSLPPSEQPRRPRGAGGVSFALILIGVGTIFLLYNLGVIGLNWREIARFWPALLILLGLDIVIGRQSMAGSVAVGVLTLGALAGIVWYAQTPAGQPASSGLVTGTIHVPFEDVKALKVFVTLVDAPLELTAQHDEMMVHGEFTVLAGTEPKIDYKVEGDTGVVTIIQPPPDIDTFPFNAGFDPVQPRMTLELPEGIPVELHVTTDLGETTLDLTNLQITDLDVKAGSGKADVTLPKSGKLGDVHIEGDLGQVIVTAPDGSKLDMGSLDVQSGSGQLTLTLPAEGKLGDMRVKGDLGQVIVSIPDNAKLDIGSYSVTSGSGALTADLPSQGVVGDVTIKGDLGSVTVGIPGGPQGVTVKSLDVKSGSGALNVTLPDGGDYEAKLEADLGAVTVTLPDSLEARFDISVDLGKVSADNNRLKSAGADRWETDGYATATNRATVTIKSGSGSVTIE